MTATRAIHRGQTAEVLRFDLPTSWGVVSPGVVTLKAYTTDGTLLATVDVAMLVSSLSAALAAGVAVASTAHTVDMAAGEVWRVAGTTRHEDIEIEGVVAGAGGPPVVPTALTLSRDAIYSHASGTALFARQARASLNTTAAAWAVGAEIRLVWSYATTAVALPIEPPVTEIALVREYVTAIAGLREKFLTRWPDEYKLAEERWVGLEDQAMLAVRMRLAQDRREIDAITDQRMLEAVILSEIRLFILEGGGSQWADEITHHRTRMSEEWAALRALPLWADDNQDGIKTTGEVQGATWFPLEKTW